MERLRPGYSQQQKNPWPKIDLLTLFSMLGSNKAKERVPYEFPDHPPGVVPSGESASKRMAADSNLTAVGNWAGTYAAGGVINASFSEGLQFLGYPYLAELTQRPEYRVISEVWAEESTRKWIKFDAVGDDDKTDQITQLNDEFERLEVKENFYKLVRDDGFFGRSHLYLDFGTTDDRDELKTPIGDGQNYISRMKVSKTSPLKRIKTVEAYWAYPTNYDSVDPLKPSWYKPEHWFVMGKELHVSRLLTFVGREVPDMLKPAYSFGGLSLSQMAKPYVDNWLQTRQSVNDLIQAFVTWGLKTNLAESLQPGGEQLFNRVALFNILRNNKGMMMIDKDTEEFFNVTAPLGTLDQLQAQAQEHMAAVSRIPLVKLLGISPHGLNATAEPEIRVFYDTIHAFQEHFIKRNLTRVLHFVMLSIWGKVDHDITFSFEPLWALDEKQLAELRKVEAETGQIHMDTGTISQEEERKRIANDPETLYPGLDPDDMPELKQEEEGGLVPKGAGAGLKAELGEGGGGPSESQAQGEAPAATGAKPPSKSPTSNKSVSQEHASASGGGSSSKTNGKLSSILDAPTKDDLGDDVDNTALQQGQEGPAEEADEENDEDESEASFVDKLARLIKGLDHPEKLNELDGIEGDNPIHAKDKGVGESPVIPFAQRQAHDEGEFKEEDHPRDKDGKFGSGGEKTSAKVVLSKSKVEDIQSQHGPYNLGHMMPEVRQKFFEQYGHSAGTFKKTMTLLDQHGYSKEIQSEADKELADHISKGDEIGKLLYDMAQYETAVADAWVSGIDTREQKAKKEFKDDWGLIGNTDAYENWQEQWDAEEAYNWKEKDIKLYRGGKLGGTTESWTTDSRGAWTGNAGRIKPNHESSVGELKKEGYLPVAGLSMMVGAPGEGEVLMAKFPESYRKEQAQDEADFKESDHPRDDDGKFTEGGGSSGSSAESKEPEKAPEKPSEKASETKKAEVSIPKLGETKESTLGGVKFKKLPTRNQQIAQLRFYYSPEKPSEDQFLDMIGSMLEDGVTPGKEAAYGTEGLLFRAGIDTSKLADYSDEQIDKALQADPEKYKEATTGIGGYKSSYEPGGWRETHDYITGRISDYVSASNISSEEGQNKVADMLIAASKEPDAWGSVNNHTKAVSIALYGVRGYRGDVLDRMGENIKDPSQYPALGMYSPDYDTFIKSFTGSWRATGGTDAYRRAYVALADFGPNSGHKFWEGKQPLTESEKVVSPNVKKNLEQLYNNTQAFFKKKFATKSDPDPDLSKKMIAVKRGVGGMDHAAYTPAAVESWTTDAFTPDRFGKFMSRDGGYSVLTATVPYSSLLFTYQSVPGLDEKEVKGKKEYVVMGGALNDIETKRIPHRKSGYR